jgi:hypothetical protein
MTSSGGYGGDVRYSVPESAVPSQPGPARPQPRRADTEVVGGKPVFVVYRPSRGLEVREDLRDTDHAMGR